MKYLPDQKTKARRIKPAHLKHLQDALLHFARKTSTTNPALRRQIRQAADALPAYAPYELRLFPHEWEIISKALRPVGSNPPPGGQFAKWFALYTLLRKTFVFRTEGEAARALSSRRVGT